MKIYQLSTIYKKYLSLFKVLQQNKEHKFKFVGGMVRDAILNLPFKDYDIASNLPPEVVMDLLKKNKIKVIPTGLKHGTITVIYKKQEFQITTLRKDVTCYGRAADVVFIDDFYEDAQRRDFTFNALYWDPMTNELTDYFNGLNDLKNGEVKFINSANDRIREDYLRILRFFRFYSRYGKEHINKDLLNIFKENASKLNTLPKERIEKEFSQILMNNNKSIFNILYTIEQ